MNQLILTHFPSKPYRYLKDVTLTCNLNVNQRLRCMMMCLSKQTNGKRDWSKSNVTNSNIAFSKMLPFLDKTVRVPKVKIWISQTTIMKQENIDQLKSLSHIWENAQVDFTTNRYTEEYLMSRAKLLSEAKFFRCRPFKCLFWTVMLPLCPEIYSLESVEVNNFTSIYTIKDYLKSIVQLVENRALYPNSQTTFVFSGNRYEYATHHGSMPCITNELLQNIGNKLMESDKAQSFRIVFAIYEGSELPDGEMDEIRLENKRTREVLHLRRVIHNEVAKYCEFDAKTKYFILERPHV
ncbi:hypothetical protein DdX_13364 [Ditylenchus destructor]|uniref:Uncharacterized protein n=1 Tax=Ditylenchus destructor TaxID=166010 RepID=A0AAD4MUT2_9BILA|nr:hypothetical protein DdX_13364 [Ditylenchus destructor]